MLNGSTVPHFITSLVVGGMAAAILFSQPIDGASGNGAPLADSVVKANGVGGFDAVTEIDYIFHAKGPDMKIVRQWQWFPKAEMVIYTGKDPDGNQVTVNYQIRKVAAMPPDSSIHAIHGWFVHDNYWLLFPLHLAWDTGFTVVRKNSEVMPISGKWATGLIVTYSSKDPNRPADKFELFIDSTNLVREWVFRPSKESRAEIACKWEDYKRFNSLYLSLNRPSQNERKMRIWFTDVLVKTRE